MNTYILYSRHSVLCGEELVLERLQTHAEHCLSEEGRENMRDVILTAAVFLSSVRSHSSSDLTTFLPLDVNIGDGAKTKLQVFVPTQGELTIRQENILELHFEL